MKEAGFEFDVAYTSVLTRAITTCNLALEALGQAWLPTIKEWKLNERHYGALSGLNKAETSAKHGEDQVKIWRRSFDVPPPALDETNEHWPGHDRRYSAIAREDLPLTESLAITCDRVVPFWEKELAPRVRAGERLLVVAHGNSLRALVKHLDGIDNDSIIEVNIPTGVPLVYRLDEKTLKPLGPPEGETAAAPLTGYYLGDPEAIAAEAAKVAAQASARS
jgi:2,3-bisphosphoglycerate-dependent phosphoglycerate mutase